MINDSFTWLILGRRVGNMRRKHTEKLLTKWFHGTFYDHKQHKHAAYIHERRNLVSSCKPTRMLCKFTSSELNKHDLACGGKKGSKEILSIEFEAKNQSQLCWHLENSNQSISQTPRTRPLTKSLAPCLTRQRASICATSTEHLILMM